jgi:vinculin
VILHEEAEDGAAMPDLEKPVQAVSKAVANLIKVRFYIIIKHQFQNETKNTILKEKRNL